MKNTERKLKDSTEISLIMEFQQELLDDEGKPCTP